MIKIYNTLSRKKEDLIPLVENEIKFYVCGPTVYDYFHLGNSRSFIMSDIIRRYLEYAGYKVKFVMNLTDVDDKIINKANQEGISPKELSEKYIKAFFEDLDKLKVKKADVNPKATEHMQEIIELIKKLEDEGIAYNVHGDVFFNVSKFKEYGKLSGKKLDELEIGKRIEVNDLKQTPLDFALWKKAKEGEPFWESPWGNGRPGWHIECSAMSCKHLGESFDIHAGGNDLIFPHHENEIAQSEAATKKQFVKYWIHFGFLNVDKVKMSKSLGNFFTAREVLKLNTAEAIRLFFSQTHYGGPLNYSTDLLDAAQKGTERIAELYSKIVNGLITSDSKENSFDIDKFYNDFNSAMDDDFNTPKAAGVIFDFVKEANRYIAEGNASKEFYEQAKKFLEETAEGVLGVIKTSVDETKVSLEGDLIQLLINLRTDVKKEKNFALSDKIRDSLKELGIVLQDSKEGTTYKKL